MKRVYKMVQVFSYMFIKILTIMHIEIDYLSMSRGFTGEPLYYDILRAAISHHIKDNSNRYKDFILGILKTIFQKCIYMEYEMKLWNSSFQWDLQCKR